jgi:hypothetical protein
MVWQKWKEGYARWIENLVKRALGLEENKGGFYKPYSRVLFYASGEAFFNILIMGQPKLVNDLQALFKELYSR